MPQAGNTGLVGGQMPMNGEIVLSVGRLKKVRALDAQGFTMTVEAGMTLAEVQAAADGINRLFPLSLPSEGTCQIGGNLGTNAGGVGVLAYGNARQLVLGLEVVLADGRIWNGPQRAQEGQHRLRPARPVHRLGRHARHHHGRDPEALPQAAEKATAFVALPAVDAALALFSLAQEAAGQSLTAFEIMCATALDMVLRNVHNTRDPFSARHPWYALIETSGSRPTAPPSALLTEVLEAATERGCIRRHPRQLAHPAEGLLAPARVCSEAQQPEGDSIKTDVSVPIAKDPRVHRARRRRRRRNLPRRAARSARPLRRRQRALQHQPARRHAQGRVHGAVERNRRRRARHRARLRRLDLRRARHRPDETRRTRPPRATSPWT